MENNSEIDTRLGNLCLKDLNSARVRSDTPCELEEIVVVPINSSAHNTKENLQPTVENARNGEVEATESIQFQPPVYLQRYGAIREVLNKLLEDSRYKDLQNGSTVLEAGCAEFGLHVFLKGLLQLGKIIYVDIDEKLLQERKHNLKPLPAEYLQKLSRPKPLIVEAFAGDITKVDSRLLSENPKIWCVVAIELIEHLYPQDLRGFEISVFGVISPPVVVITTPNSDFNTIFNLPPGKFRHWDHKFEWTRSEFVQWCQKVCSEFPDYGFSIDGIGAGPPETASLGCVSQMAVFIKQQQDPYNSSVSNSQLLYPGVVQNDAYKLIESIEYPNYIETRTTEEIIVHDLNYTIQHYWLSKRNIENCMENNTTELLYPLSDIMEILRIPQTCGISVEHLSKILISANFEVQFHETNGFHLRIPVALWDHEPSSIVDSEEEMEEDIDMDVPFANNQSSTTEDSDDFWE